MKNRRTKMKRLTGIITAICMVIIFSGVSIFGSQAQTLSDGNGGSMEVTTDGEYIYLEYSGSWTNYIQQIFDISVNGQTAPGALSKLVINTGNNGDGSSFNVLNAWYQAIDGATGYTTNTGASSSGWGSPGGWVGSGCLPSGGLHRLQLASGAEEGPGRSGRA